jgi:ankyrin repeat protein
VSEKSEFESLLARYRRSPEFLCVEIEGPNQTGITGDTLLHAAVVRGESEDVDVLMAVGAQVNAVGDLGNTPLHHAASRGLAEIARKLLRYGADPRIRNEFGQTPLDLATLMKRQNVAQLLKETNTTN